jgi:SH3 domain-containing YSC84-like protein 1
LDITDYMIVLHDLEAVRAFTGDGQVSLESSCPNSNSPEVSLGGEVKVSVGGVGRTGAGELLVGDHGLATAISYCHSKGLFAGISLEGSMIISRPEINLNFYGHPVTPYQLLSGEVCPPEAASCLYQALNTAMETSDRYHGITRQERQHQEMLKFLDPRNSTKFLSSKERRNGEEDDLARGIGDQYY